MRLGKVWVLGLGLVSLAACSGGGGGGGNGAIFDDLESRALAFESLSNEVTNMAPTRNGSMPNSGTARFVGQAGIFVIEQETAEERGMVLVGTADLTADFGAKTVTGTLGNFLGASGDLTQDEPRPEDTFRSSGTITIGANASTIGEDNTPAVLTEANEWASDFRGNLTTPEGTARFDTVIEGQFMGTRVSPTPDRPATKAILGIAAQEDMRIGTKTYDAIGSVVAKN